MVLEPVNRISVSGLEFIKQHEGFREEAYLDVANVPTIGYGTTHIKGMSVQLGTTITEAQATQELEGYVNHICWQVMRMVIIPFSQNQLDAVLDFCYNLGVTSFQNSTLRKMINARQPVLQHHFTDWDKTHVDGQLVEVEGLYNRRLDEYHLFTKESTTL